MPTEEIIKIDLTIEEVLKKYGFVFILKKDENVLKELYCPKCNELEGLITETEKEFSIIIKPDSCLQKGFNKFLETDPTIEDFAKCFVTE